MKGRHVLVHQVVLTPLVFFLLYQLRILQMTILYSCIARGTTILCSQSNAGTSFENEVTSMLPNIPTRNDGKTTYTSNRWVCCSSHDPKGDLRYHLASDRCPSVSLFTFQSSFLDLITITVENEEYFLWISLLKCFLELTAECINF
jgi:hypothetical protein